MTVAASALADKTAFGHRSSRVATGNHTGHRGLPVLSASQTRFARVTQAFSADTGRLCGPAPVSMFWPSIEGFDAHPLHAGSHV